MEEMKQDFSVCGKGGGSEDIPMKTWLHAEIFPSVYMKGDSCSSACMNKVL